MFQNKPSQAKDFFEKVKQGKNSFLESLINSTPPTFEADWLDFKGAEKLKLGEKDKDRKIREIWSTALSGFANSGGGILVWGIDARKDTQTQIDSASSFSLVEYPAKLKSRLIELHSQSTSPPVNGVEYWHSPINNGFLVCYIPESPFKPVRSEVAGKQYYIRAGDSFQTPSVSLLRSLFYPEYQAFLEVELLPSYDSDLGNIVKGVIYNTGSATAKNCMLTIETNINPQDFHAEHGSHWDFMSHPVNNREQASRALLCRISLHPGIEDDCFEIQIKPHSNYFDNDKTIDFMIHIYSENNNPLCTKISIKPHDINNKKTIRGKTEIVNLYKY